MFVSLDVVDMFGSVDPKKAIDVLIRKLDNVPEAEFRNQLQMTKPQCVHLIRYFLDNNYFRYGDQFYTQTQGLAMGSSLSPLLADLVMEEIEVKIIKRYKKITVWRRFVDDTFFRWAGHEEELDGLLEFVNSLDPVIKFTMEKEKERSLNFLDVKIVRDLGGNISTSVFKKPTSGDGLIHFQSGHPLSLKVNTARQHWRRICHYCSDEQDREFQRKKLKEALMRLQYKKQIIYKILSPFHVNPGAPPVEKRPVKGRNVVLQYQPEVRRCIVDHEPLRQANIAWGQRNVVLNALRSRNFPCKNLKMANAIYVIPCSCQKIYIGETKRQVFIRIKEHQAYLRKHDVNSKIVQHLDAYPNHVIQWEMAFVLDSEINTYFRKAKESAYIELNKNICISDKSVEIDDNWRWVMRAHTEERRHYGVKLSVLKAR